MKKHFSFLGLAALLTAAALTSCQKEEWEMDSPSESENDLELADDGTRATYTGSNYKLTSDWIKNPEKGLYQHVEYKFENNKIPSIDNISFSDGTLVLLQVYLRDFRDKELSSAALTTIKTLFSKVKAANKKAIVRFSYTYESSSWPKEAPKDMVLKHIKQLTPYLQDYLDYILVFQAGFIGSWGEWYYTTNEEFNWSLKENNGYSGSFSARKEVVNAMLNAVKNEEKGIYRQVALRGPSYKRFYLHSDGRYGTSDKLSSFSTSNNGRIAFYNDAFMCDKYYEMGTFGASRSDSEIGTNKKMWKEQSAYLFCGGETANNRSTDDEMYSKDPVSWIKEFHMSYLNRRSSADVDKNGNVTYSSRLFYKWMEKGLEPSIKNALGYNLWMNSFEMKGNYSKGSSSSQNAQIVFSLNNAGAAPVIYKRPMKIVFIRNSDKKVTELASSTGSAPNNLYFTSDSKKKSYSKGSVADIRLIPSGETRYFTCSIGLPANIKSGDMIALWMPDQSSSLRSNYNYSIHLSNKTGSSYGNVKWLEYKDRDGSMAGFNAIYTF